MEFYSAERPEGMLGEGVDFAVLDEAALMPENIWAQVVRPTLMDRQGGGSDDLHAARPQLVLPRLRRGQSAPTTTPSGPPGPSPPGRTSSCRGRDRGNEERPSSGALRAGGRGEVHRCRQQRVRGADEIIRPMVKPQGHVVFGIDLAKTTDYTVIYGANARRARTATSTASRMSPGPASAAGSSGRPALLKKGATGSRS
jgi:hypothetical protein